jgi:DNA-binding MarR family transcriptional regulator
VKNDLAVIDELMGRIMNEIHSHFGKQVNYSKDVLATPAEAHFVEAIQDHPDTNTNEIAEILGLTKANISLRAARLCKKGYIEKYNRPNNRKEIYYKLTPLGRTLYDAHTAYHFNRNRSVYQRFNALPEEEKKLIASFLLEYAKYMGDFYNVDIPQQGGER